MAEHKGLMVNGQPLKRTKYYLCDQKKCENCVYPDCKNTDDPSHAQAPDGTGATVWGAIDSGIMELTKEEHAEMLRTGRNMRTVTKA